MHHCALLPVTSTFTANGDPVLLIGWAIDLAEDSDDPRVQISSSTSEQLILRYRTWSGRWLLVVRDRIHGDAIHSIPVFYRLGLVSSSLRLVQEVSGAEHRREHFVDCGVGPDWFPGPSTSVLGVTRLLPSQTLSLATSKPEHRPLVSALSVQNPSVCFSNALAVGMKRLKANYENIFVALTGGLDSRTVLASAYASGMRPITYTQDYGNLSPGDQLLPPILAKQLGLSHWLIPKDTFNPEKQSNFDEHSLSQCTLAADRSFYSCGMWDGLPAGSLVLRGGCFEFGRAYLYRMIPKDFDPGAPDAATGLHAMLYRPLNSVAPFVVSAIQRRQQLMTASLKEWLSWVVSHPEPHLDFRDRFYLEQRLGCWLATAEQALDITKTVRINVANSHYILSLMNLARLEERIDSSYQRAAIRTLAPAIHSFPYNPTSKWGRMRQKTFGNVGRLFKALSFLTDKR